jgi:hypothetical protein
MSTLPIPVVGCFAGFSVFSYYQQQHYRRFEGASKVFELVLGLSTVSSMLVWLVFLVYCAIKVVWWGPFALIGLDLAIFPLGLLLGRAITPFGMSMLGFIAWPLLAYFMFTLTPKLG